VISVEPQADLVPLLRSNVARNHLRNVHVEVAALGRAPGVASLFQVSDNDGQATLRLGKRERPVGKPARVVVHRLDELMATLNVPHVDAMKIDVEGAENDVIAGFDAVLRSHPPSVIFVECIDRHLRRFDSSAHQLLDCLGGYGYRVYRFSKLRWHEVDSTMVNTHGAFTADLACIHQSVPLGVP
jgi:FkbM family methyltransferase